MEIKLETAVDERKWDKCLASYDIVKTIGFPGPKELLDHTVMVMGGGGEQMKAGVKKHTSSQ